MTIEVSIESKTNFEGQLTGIDQDLGIESRDKAAVYSMVAKLAKWFRKGRVKNEDGPSIRVPVT